MLDFFASVNGPFYTTVLQKHDPKQFDALGNLFTGFNSHIGVWLDPLLPPPKKKKILAIQLSSSQTGNPINHYVWTWVGSLHTLWLEGWSQWREKKLQGVRGPGFMFMLALLLHGLVIKIEWITWHRRCEWLYFALFHCCLEYSVQFVAFRFCNCAVIWKCPCWVFRSGWKLMTGFHWLLVQDLFILHCGIACCVVASVLPVP